MVTLWGETETKLLPDDTCEHPDTSSHLRITEEMPNDLKRSIMFQGAHKCSKPRTDGRNQALY